MANERTYIMIKPDGVERGLVGEIIKRFENKGYQLIALRMMKPSQQLLEEHYADLKAKKFFPGLMAVLLLSWHLYNHLIGLFNFLINLISI